MRARWVIGVAACALIALVAVYTAREPARVQRPAKLDVEREPELSAGTEGSTRAPAHRERTLERETAQARIDGFVHDVSGGPIAGASIWVENQIAAQTDERGNFEISAPEGARIAIMVRASGYALGWAQAVAPGTVDVALVPGGSISGRVIDEQGRGLASIPVLNVGPTSTTATTAEAGRFAFFDLEPGQYTLKARGDRWRGELEEVVGLGVGESVSDVVIVARPAYWASGTVVIGLDETPCARGSMFLEEQPNWVPEPAAAIEDGRATIRGLASGEHRISVQCEGYVTQEQGALSIIDRDLTGIRWRIDRGHRLTGRVLDADRSLVSGTKVAINAESVLGRPLVIRSDEEGRFEAELAPGEYNLWHFESRTSTSVTIRDRDVHVELVERREGDATIRGLVVDTNGRPGANLDVNLFNGQGRDGDETDAAGRFQIDRLKAGRFQLEIRDEMYRSVELMSKEHARIDLRPSEVREVKIVIEARDGTISGRVLDSVGEPAPDAFVIAFDGPGDFTPTVLMQDRGVVLTDPNGRFTIRDLPRRPHTVVAARPHGHRASKRGVAVGANITLTLMEPGSISGTVKSGGTPATQAIIRIWNAMQGEIAEKRLEGPIATWSFKLAPDRYRILAEKNGRFASRTIDLAPGENIRGVELELTAGGLVTGRAVDAVNGAAIGGLDVHAWSRFEGSSRAKTEADGSFRLEGVPPGSMTIAIGDTYEGHGGHCGRALDVEVAIERTIDLGSVSLHRSRATPQRAILGIRFRTDTKAVEISELMADLPAARSGLRVGDVIVSIDGISVANEVSLTICLAKVAPGREVKLGLADGRSVSIVAEAAEP
jgi:hypothetical protein